MKIRINRRHKDSLFVRLFGNSDDKQPLLDLYNYLTGRHLTDAGRLKINTRKNILYISEINDVSFLAVDVEEWLLEHQSTWNPNMPFRMLKTYIQKVDGMIKKSENLYGSKPVKIPAPQCYVLYNGEQKVEDVTNLLLSDMFKESPEGNKVSGYEWTVKVININSSHNLPLMQSCPDLKDYSDFIQKIRDNQKCGMSKEDAVESAITDFSKDDSRLGKILNRERREVFGMIVKGIKEKDYRKVLVEEAREEERQLAQKRIDLAQEQADLAQEQVRDIRIQMITYLLREGKSDAEIAEAVSLSVGELRKFCEENGIEA